jgi:hypothetical protein
LETEFKLKTYEFCCLQDAGFAVIANRIARDSAQFQSLRRVPVQALFRSGARNFLNLAVLMAVMAVAAVMSGLKLSTVSTR